MKAIKIESCTECPSRDHSGAFTNGWAYPLCRRVSKSDLPERYRESQLSPGFEGSSAILPWEPDRSERTGDFIRRRIDEIPEWCPLMDLPDSRPKEPLTEEEEMESNYVKNQGNHCPSCRSANITGGPFDVDGGEATQEMGCDECGASWEDLYNLTGYLNLDIPKKTYDCVFTIAFTMKGVDNDEGVVPAYDVRRAIYSRLDDLSDEELVHEAIQLNEAVEEQE